MTKSELADIYRAYIACLNAQAWADLGAFVHDGVIHNRRAFGLPGYRAMLEQDFRAIPDLVFKVDLLVADPPLVASRLRFDCTPRGTFLDLPVNGKAVSFTENVFYRFEGQRIREVFSVIDKVAIEAQLQKSNMGVE